ncbi:glycosyltransferase family A protein [Microbacterium sp. ET2]|uniref:glycosyltransferase family A protein n=1 Tax=Microbacterium albipurpureum TaxID=3050384 RepID=UPI00259C8DD3|nr:glycosyltransferase family A protein [Microbacterium sp. ET2 (Ac-2212)]WJL95094.1 glycosyltransferase family A protein [Microbacterium sp. ET2 (Ac-2212)]
MTDPAVDLVIAVHDPARRIDRAVASALTTVAPLRVTVVAHNTDPAAIAERLGAAGIDPRVRVVALADGVRSPAGPFNHGLDLATASYTSIMGSDDELELGAIDSWLTLAERTGADAVITHLRHAGGVAVPTPPTRPRTRRVLDPVADRLSYRSAPLGLVSRARFGDLRLTEGVMVGEDLPLVTRLWFSGARISYDRRGPAYLIHDDAADRTTMTPRPLADSFAFLPHVFDAPWFAGLPPGAREAVVVKFLRIHLFGAVTYRPDAALWTAGERAALSDAATRMIRHGEGAERLLSRRDRVLLDAALDPRRPAEELIAAAARRRQFSRPGALLPRSLRYALHREAPLRFAVASALQLR